MKKKSMIPGIIIIALVLFFIYAPILILAVYSFTDAANIGAAGSFSLENYAKLFTTEELRSMIIGTLALAVGSSVLSTLLGTTGAIGMFYSHKVLQKSARTVNQIPVVNADVVTGFSICILLVVFFGMSKDTFLPLVIGHMTLTTPFVYLSVLPKLQQMDPALYEAALDLGASPSYALRKVVLPEILPGVLSGFALAITLSLDDYFVATYTKPATFDTISTYVVNATKGSQTQIKTALWALSTVIFALVLLFALFQNARKNRNNARKEEQAA